MSAAHRLGRDDLRPAAVDANASCSVSVPVRGQCERLVEQESNSDGSELHEKQYSEPCRSGDSSRLQLLEQLMNPVHSRLRHLLKQLLQALIMPGEQPALGL